MMTKQTPPIIPGKDSTLTGRLVNQEAESNDNDAYVLGLDDAMMEIKSSYYGKDKFLPYVQNWLDAAETKTKEWVQPVLKPDNVSL
ncbi:hypothetical protein O181_007898 [Austropuccinia psidii MF-1]|uniref:Uncharacterized protein n=1 Tax=Austropuccinia psidii MF-1 TaxID=1389203 RepID=A0A9Q3BN46_9BASI|nr:hypothetical protein [Austropuccinia psidii MF-1]